MVYDITRLTAHEIAHGIAHEIAHGIAETALAGGIDLVAILERESTGET